MKHPLSILLLSLSLSLSLSTLTAGEITFRGAWVATVANIDWPTKNAVGNESLQKTQMIHLLDSLHDMGINAIVFQVRPTADALYASPYEPWAHWLTGQQGRAASYDPLAWTIQQCHQRGMELHAWINPFRLNIATMDTCLWTSKHIFYQHPDWFWKYGKIWYFNPAYQSTRDYICKIVKDIVTRYDVDAIHMDDYFYPYPVAKQPLPDASDFKRYPRGFSNIDDWRRDNVNLTVQAISETIHQTKPNVQFGISPFGIYRSDSLTLSNYNDLYADVLLWIEKGWIDYVIPQLYWSFGSGRTDYATLAQWWADAVDKCNAECRVHHAQCNLQPVTCNLYIGLASYKLGNKGAWSNGNEIARQMRFNRQIKGITGECFYSTRPLLKNPQHVCDSIKAFYSKTR